MRSNHYRLSVCLLPALLAAGTGYCQTPATPPAAQAAAPAQLTPEQQRLQLLIQHVESAYSSGEEAYRKGELAEAKTEFDRAVDLMLTSGLDIKSDPQLQDEFDRIVDAVSALEVEALKQGNGFVPKVEESPSDVASDVTFEADPNIVAKAQTELATTQSDLPLVVNDYVATYINFFANSTRGHYTLLHSFQRSGRYKAMIQRVMAEEGVPQDLIYLAVAESGFQPQALNRRSGAGGMWQFMPHGDYGLARTGYVDERFDPEKSTRAYARYMKFIYNQLGDWYLSMAAYDWGAGNVQRAVQKTGYADFWELYKRNNLPAETKNYVPEILAAIIIAKNPLQYGFDDLALDPPALTDTVTINYSVDLRLAADIVNVPVEVLVGLNPSLLRMTTPPDEAFDLHLPAGAAPQFNERIAGIPESKRAAWRYHRVAADETVASIAREYHVSAAELAAANQLSESATLAGVEALVVPTAPAAAPMHAMLYIVRKGDTQITVADRFGISLDQLHRWNHLTGFKVEVGRRLHVAEPAHLAHEAGGHRSRRAARGAGSESRAAQKPENMHEQGSSKASASRTPAANEAKKAVPQSVKKTQAHKPQAHAASSSSKEK
jgi:membrane-bound lytic murein transglycosylase D